MKNCADSAAQAMSMAAARMDGVVHNTEEGSTSRMVPADSRISAQTGTAARWRLSETDTGIPADDGMLFKFRTLHREVCAKVRAAALLAAKRASRDEQRDLAKVASFGPPAGQRPGFTAVVLQTRHGLPQLITTAHDTAQFPGDLADLAGRHQRTIEPRGLARRDQRRGDRLPHGAPGTRAKYHSFEQGVARQPVSPVNAGTGYFAGGEEPGQAGVAIQIRADATHGVVRRRPHGGGLTRNI